VRLVCVCRVVSWHRHRRIVRFRPVPVVACPASPLYIPVPLALAGQGQGRAAARRSPPPPQNSIKNHTGTTILSRSTFYENLLYVSLSLSPAEGKDAPPPAALHRHLNSKTTPVRLFYLDLHSMKMLKLASGCSLQQRFM
jgi:hypothetical protein